MNKTTSFKNTKKRQKILDIIKNSSVPITAEEIFFKIKDEKINLSTIYRTLITLEECGFIEKNLSSDKRNYYCIKNNVHSHYLICSNCKKMVKLDICPLNEICDEISHDTGFIITSHLLEIRGICSQCSKKE